LLLVFEILSWQLVGSFGHEEIKHFLGVISIDCLIMWVIHNYFIDIVECTYYHPPANSAT
jgi:hypothetical protein